MGTASQGRGEATLLARSKLPKQHQAVFVTSFNGFASVERLTCRGV